MRWNAVALGSCLLGAGIGCGGGSDDAPLAPAHSSSFYPVRGTTDAGGPADRIEWVYRLNGGAAVPLGSLTGVTVRYGDEHVRVAGTAMTTSLNGTIASADGSISGSLSQTSTDQLSGDAPATVLSRDLRATTSVTVAGSGATTVLSVMYDFGAMPEPTFFDRPDLDTLAINYAENAAVSATAHATATVTNSEGPTTSTTDDTITLTLYWTMQEVLPSFRVLDRDYANVVQVQQAITAAGSNGQETAITINTIWLAKGIGMIRAESMSTQPNGDETDTYELLSTNLVAP